MKSLKLVFTDDVAHKQAMPWSEVPKHFPFSVKLAESGWNPGPLLSIAYPKIPTAYYIVTGIDRDPDNRPGDFTMHDPCTGIVYRYPSNLEDHIWSFAGLVGANVMVPEPEPNRCICIASPVPGCPDHDPV